MEREELVVERVSATDGSAVCFDQVLRRVEDRVTLGLNQSVDVLTTLEAIKPHEHALLQFHVDRAEEVAVLLEWWATRLRKMAGV